MAKKQNCTYQVPTIEVGFPVVYYLINQEKGN